MRDSRSSTIANPSSARFYPNSASQDAIAFAAGFDGAMWRSSGARQRFRRSVRKRRWRLIRPALRARA